MYSFPSFYLTAFSKFSANYLLFFNEIWQHKGANSQKDDKTEENQMVLIKEYTQSSRRIEQGSLFNSLVRWATLQPEATFIVEAETGCEISYAQTLAAVHAFRQVLGDTPRHLALALPGS